MRKVKDIRMVAYLQTVGVEFLEMKREQKYAGDGEIAVFYFNMTDDDYDMYSTNYIKSIILEYEQNLDMLKTMIFKLTNNKI